MAPQPPYQAPSPVVNDEGKLILQGAIKDANMARSNFDEMTWEDIIAGRNRARVQSMVDGGAPKSQYASRLTGGGRETLVNWGDGERILHEECAPYLDLVISNETFGTTPIDRDFADESTRADNEAIIAEELTAMVSEWGDFYSRKIASIMECKTHGISFDYHEDDINWQWRTAGLKDFKIHRNTLIGVKNIEECGVRVMLSPRTLYKKISNPEIAKLAGWNVEAVRTVIMRAAPLPTTFAYETFEEWEAYWKDNNYLMGGSKRVCPCIYFWHAELDGSVSQYLLPEDTGNDFLYQKSSRFADISQFLHVYTDNVGTNTHYHSIRGLANRLFAVVQTLNRKINRASDLSDFASSPILQPDSESEADSEATDQSGPFVILKPGWKIPDHKIPDYQLSVIPMMEFFRNRLNVMTSRVPTSQLQTGRPTKYGEQAQMEQSARLSDADMETYLIVWQGQWREIVRRACRKGYLPVEPGGKEVAEFRRRCKQRGVPPEAIDNVDWKRSRVSRGLGAGSAAARIVQLDRLQPWYSALDPVSQEKFKRMYFMAAGNIQLANELTPKTEDRILPVDASLADVQNNQLMQGMQIPVRDGQNHVVIAAIRLQKLTELNQVIVQGGEPALMQLVEPMSFLLQDLEAQLEKANPDDPIVRHMLQTAQQFNEMVTNGLRHKQRLEQNAQREAQHNAGKVGSQMGPDGAPTPQNGQESQQSPSGGPDTSETGRALEMSIRLQTKMEDLRFLSAKHEQQLAQARREAQQRIDLANMTAAANLRR